MVDQHQDVQYKPYRSAGSTWKDDGDTSAANQTQAQRPELQGMRRLYTSEPNIASPVQSRRPANASPQPDGHMPRDPQAHIPPASARERESSPNRASPAQPGWTPNASARPSSNSARSDSSNPRNPQAHTPPESAREREASLNRRNPAQPRQMLDSSSWLDEKTAQNPPVYTRTANTSVREPPLHRARSAQSVRTLDSSTWLDENMARNRHGHTPGAAVCSREPSPHGMRPPQLGWRSNSSTWPDDKKVRNLQVHSPVSPATLSPYSPNSISPAYTGQTFNSSRWPDDRNARNLRVYSPVSPASSTQYSPNRTSPAYAGQLFNVPTWSDEKSARDIHVRTPRSPASSRQYSSSISSIKSKGSDDPPPSIRVSKPSGSHSVRVPTRGARLKSGFPYHPGLYDMKVRPDDWQSFTDEIIESTKLETGDLAKVWASATSVALLTPGFVTSFWVGRSVERKIQQKLVKSRMQDTSADSLGGILHQWNDSYFSSLGLYARLEIAEGSPSIAAPISDTIQNHAWFRNVVQGGERDRERERERQRERLQEREVQKYVIVVSRIDEGNVPSDTIQELATGNGPVELPTTQNPNAFFSELPGDNGRLPTELAGDSGRLPTELEGDDGQLLNELIGDYGRLPTELPSNESVAHEKDGIAVFEAVELPAEVPLEFHRARPGKCNEIEAIDRDERFSRDIAITAMPQPLAKGVKLRTRSF